MVSSVTVAVARILGPSLAMKRVHVLRSSNISHFLPFKPKSSHIHFSWIMWCSSLNPAPQPQHVPPQISDLYKRKDPVTFASALAFSSRTNSTLLGTQIHAQIIKLGFSEDIFSQNNLVVMYSKCEVLSDALKLFGEMAEKNLVSWTSMISGLVQNNEHDMGLELYMEMTRCGFCPNEFTLTSVLSTCALIQAVDFGYCIHSIALKLGLDRNPFFGTSLLLMYAKCGNIEAAELVFERIDNPDLACWNAMVEGYARTGYGYDAMRTVTIMYQKGLTADQFTYISALKGCSAMGSLGRQIHCLIIQNEFENNSGVMNSLVDMYFRTGMKDSGVKVFGKTREKDVVSWNTVISGFVQEEDEKQVVNLFSEMLLTGLKPNQVTFSVIFRLCGARNDLSLGLQFFCFACHLGCLNDILVINSLINMFSKCAVVESAYFLFSDLATRNLVTWNEMIQGYNLNGYSLEALQLFHSLVKLGIEADEFTYLNVLGACQGIQDQKTGEQIHAKVIKSGFDSCSFVCCSLINAYATFGLVGSSFKIFQDIRMVDLVSWGTIISAFLKQGFCSEGLSLLNSLRERGEKPDEFILGSAMNACANVALLNQSKCFHSLVIKTGYEKHLCVGSAVIDAYAKCGDINSSKQAFDSVSRDDDAILFNTMISAYAHHGLITDAIELFEKMKHANLYPTHATFVAVISACSHLGLVEQGQHFFNSISSAYGLYPSKDNFACFVDLLARNGLIEKAKDIIENMPYEPWPAIWRSLLSGCRIYGNKEIGELAAEQILKLMPNNDGAYVLLSNVYAEDGRWEDAEKVRMKMEKNGVQKPGGYSMIAM